MTIRVWSDSNVGMLRGPSFEDAAGLGPLKPKPLVLVVPQTAQMSLPIRAPNHLLQILCGLFCENFHMRSFSKGDTSQEVCLEAHLNASAAALHTACCHKFCNRRAFGSTGFPIQNSCAKGEHNKNPKSYAFKASQP